MNITYLIERWRKGDQFVPVGMWFIPEGGKLAFYFQADYDKMVEDGDTLGSYTQQLETHFANRPDIDKGDPELLSYYAAQTSMDIDRTGPLQASVGDDFNPAEFFSRILGG